MNKIDIVTGSIFFMGSATVILSLIVAYCFYQYNKKLKGRAKKLSSSISYQLIGEAIIGMGTLLFASAAHFGWLTDWSQPLQSTIRFIMFLATSGTTWHLLRTLRKIENSEK